MLYRVHCKNFSLYSVHQNYFLLLLEHFRISLTWITAIGFQSSTFKSQMLALSPQPFKTGHYMARAWLQFCQRNLSSPEKLWLLALISCFARGRGINLHPFLNKGQYNVLFSFQVGLFSLIFFFFFWFLDISNYTLEELFLKTLNCSIYQSRY